MNIKQLQIALKEHEALSFLNTKIIDDQLVIANEMLLNDNTISIGESREGVDLFLLSYTTTSGHLLADYEQTVGFLNAVIEKSKQHLQIAVNNLLTDIMKPPCEIVNSITSTQFHVVVDYKFQKCDKAFTLRLNANGTYEFYMSGDLIGTVYSKTGILATLDAIYLLYAKNTPTHDMSQHTQM
jgi:hypothetical protein